MTEYKDITAFFEERGPEDIERFVDKNLDISQQVYTYLKEKNWTQKEFAHNLGKSEAQISKWLSGTHNITLRSIAKMEAVLGEDIIVTPNSTKDSSKIEYVVLKVHSNVSKESETDYPVQPDDEKEELIHKSIKSPAA